jgi:hypothetical protein
MLRKGVQNDKIEMVPEATQAAIFENIAEQFFEVVKAIPGAIIPRKNDLLLYME